MATESYYRRYLNGEHEAVWTELIKLGSAVREAAVFSDAVAVTQEIVKRAKTNLELLHGRLLALGYEFADPANSLRLASDKDHALLDQIERDFGRLPIVLRTWYEHLGAVDFSQSESQLRCKASCRPPPGPDIFGLGSHPVLLFLGLERCLDLRRHLAEQLARGVKEAQTKGHLLDCSTELKPCLPLGGWASNCEPKAVDLPSHAIDAVLYDDGGGDTYFVDELRSAFRGGGFPFWLWSFRKKDFYSPYQYCPNFAKLLPILNEGLLDL
jgi:hypothetical protein